MSKLPMDPKVAAIMAKLQQGEKKREDVKVKEPEEPKPPKNLEEFIKFENLVCSLETWSIECTPHIYILLNVCDISFHNWCFFI